MRASFSRLGRDSSVRVISSTRWRVSPLFTAMPRSNGVSLEVVSI